MVEVFATAAAAERYADLLAGAPATLVADDALGSLGETVAPQGLVAVCRPVDRPVSDVLAGTTLAVVCADVRDPGNAGTVIRSADAAGAGAVVLAGQSVDAYNGKTVRATVGSLFHVPLAVVPDPEAALRRAGGGPAPSSLPTVPARPTSTTPSTPACSSARQPGCSATRRGACPTTLPHWPTTGCGSRSTGRAESLNLSTAAAVCLYASARAQRPRRTIA